MTSNQKMIARESSELMKSTMMEIEIHFGKGYGPARPAYRDDRVPVKRFRLSDVSVGKESVRGECAHCGTTPTDRRLYAKNGCRFCRNSVSDTFSEGW